MHRFRFHLCFAGLLCLFLGTAALAQDYVFDRENMSDAFKPPSYSPYAGRNFPTKLLWGDTHLHTNLSPDAYVQRNTTATPDDSFRFAKGAPVIDALSRAKIQIDTPLDFLVVTDHAEYVGIPKMIWEGDDKLMRTDMGVRLSLIGKARCKTGQFSGIKH